MSQRLGVESVNSNQSIVMNEEVVKNGVMDHIVTEGEMVEELVKNIKMDAKIDPKAVMDLCFSQIGGWTIYSLTIKNYWKNTWMRICCCAWHMFRQSTVLTLFSVHSSKCCQILP